MASAHWSMCFNEHHKNFVWLRSHLAPIKRGILAHLEKKKRRLKQEKNQEKEERKKEKEGRERKKES